MGRRTNEKCWACSLLSANEARTLHDAALGGDGCWKDEICHSRRSYYRKGKDQKRQKAAIAELTVPLPVMPYVVLHTYADKPRQVQDEVVIHALYAELWMGNQPIARTGPQHTFGLPPRLVKAYAKQLLDALYDRYGNGRRSGFERFASQVQHSIAQCPIRPCPYHGAHLNPYSSGGRE
ncbi:hypothetical protein ACN4EG_17705 [Alkalinema pantanalense CENA528]|uniref:hypothetical protein n=1 Tax=Alkalinema pantanalense TaxID=1620705 RepID=UPI003D6EB8EA